MNIAAGVFLHLERVCSAGRVYRASWWCVCQTERERDARERDAQGPNGGKSMEVKWENETNSENKLPFNMRTAAASVCL